MIHRLQRSLRKFPNKKENSIVISFDKLKEHTDVNGFRISARNVIISGLYDNPAGKYVLAMIDEPSREIILWSGAEYDAIGQWTNDDVIARVDELFK